METGKTEMKRNGTLLFIGESPQLIVNLENQENYIKIQDRMLPYYREVTLSQDLLAGKRKNVLETALNHYYEQACRIAEGILTAEAYQSKANVTVRDYRETLSSQGDICRYN